MLHVAFVLHVYEHYDSAKKMLTAFFTTTDWANALTKAGAKVSVFYRFHKNEYLELDGVQYHFIKDSLPPRLKNWHTARRFNQAVAKICRHQKVNIIHGHNPYEVLANAYLKRLLPHIPMLIQDHSGQTQVKYAPLLRYFLRNMDAIIFAAKGQENLFLKHQILTPNHYFFVMENSSHFKYKNRKAARLKTKIAGNPVFLWVGNLNQNKDPFTMLQAMQSVLKQIPHARLYMIYRFNDLEQEVRKMIDNNPILSQKVILLGAKERQDLGDFYNSADYIISASYKEGSGYALIEAMSCGVIPIVTQIPSFESLTHQGKIGCLYPPGDVEALKKEIFNILEKPISEESQKVVEHFEKCFSFEAIAKQTIHIYEQLLSKSTYA